jgi:hypothetical protein
MMPGEEGDRGMLALEQDKCNRQAGTIFESALGY